nr:ribonuclease H-like domain-containing protein [Tanacetum cinerariifolium]
MVAILEKYEQNTDFHQIVDFVGASNIRYALTFNPTIYVSHIRQFWSTARMETMNEGTKILATVDGILRTVTESSIWRNLKLNDEEGLSSLRTDLDRSIGTDLDSSLRTDLDSSTGTDLDSSLRTDLDRLFFENRSSQFSSNRFNKALRTMATTIEQQVALDEALVPSTKRLRIGRSNFRLPSDIQSKESTLQEFWATAYVHQHSIRFKLDNKKHIVNLETFRDMLHICPRIPGQSFDELPFEEEILEFLQHQNTQQYGAVLPIELTNEEIRNTKAYKEYYACATGEAAPKPKASTRRKRSGSDTSITPPTVITTSITTGAITPRLTAAAKGKQPAKAKIRAEGNAAGHNKNQIRCYNCRGVGHFSRDCTVRPRRRDATYLQTQLLIAQKEEAGIQLQAEEYDLMAAAADLNEIEEVNANCILMANLQQASSSGTQTDSTLNLVIKVEKVNSVNRKLKETNAALTTELARFQI